MDDFHPLFYHKHCEQVGSNVVAFVNDVLEYCAIPAVMDKTLISLIPKNENDETVKQFILISLCNTSYKIVTKLLV